MNKGLFLAAIGMVAAVTGCTQESQNQIARSMQNLTGVDGVVDIVSAGKVMYRFIDVDKLTTAQSTSGKTQARPYRFGYGVLDENLNYKQDDGEKRVYFELSEYSTPYVLYANPR